MVHSLTALFTAATLASGGDEPTLGPGPAPAAELGGQRDPSPPAEAPRLRSRGAWYAGFDLGTGGARLGGDGSAYGIGGFDGLPFLLGAHAGATLSNRWLLGADLSYLAAIGVFETYELVSLGAMATCFPAGEGFFARGGLGVARLAVQSTTLLGTTTTERRTGAEAVVGAGYAK